MHFEPIGPWAKACSDVDLERHEHVVVLGDAFAVQLDVAHRVEAMKAEDRVRTLGIRLELEISSVDPIFFVDPAHAELVQVRETVGNHAVFGQILVHVTGDALLLLGTAALGSFTTFSTLVLETERLAEDGQERLALVNLAVSVAAGLLAAGAGWGIGALL